MMGFPTKANQLLLPSSRPKPVVGEWGNQSFAALNIGLETSSMFSSSSQLAILSFRIWNSVSSPTLNFPFLAITDANNAISSSSCLAELLAF
jgi:hypothetical protein